MGKVYVQPSTPAHPIELIGYEAGVCYGSDISDSKKNYKRGLMNIKSNHGRTLEFPQVYLTLDGYSARVIREFYTHIGGAPTRLQSSTRYINYDNFKYITPPSIKRNKKANLAYNLCMNSIMKVFKELEKCSINKEDIANILPLGMETKIVVRTNLRNLIDMSHQRLCTRAYWEYRELMRDIMKALSDYSPEWEEIIKAQFIPKCELCGYCTEHNCCGRKPTKEVFEAIQNQYINKEEESNE